MTKRMLIDATHAEETRVVVLDGNRLEEFDVETSTKKQLKGNIYLAKVVRVEPSLQAAFVEYGGNRHGFLAFSEIHPDYYQIPVADRQRLLEMQEQQARDEEEEEDRAAGYAPPPSPPLSPAPTQPMPLDAEQPDIGFSPALPHRPEEQPSAAIDPPWTTEPTAEATAPSYEAPPQAAEPTDADRALEAESAGAEASLPHPDADAPKLEPQPRVTTQAAPMVQDILIPPQDVDDLFPSHDDLTIPPPPTEISFGETPEPASPAVEPAPAEAATFVPVEPAPFVLVEPAPFVLVEPAHFVEEMGADLAPEAVEPATETTDEIRTEPDTRHELDAPIEEVPPPETIGGESDTTDEMRERRIPPRFLRNYKIQEVIRRRQILLVQVVKEERGTKGAALTTYISLAGRYSVLMPNSPRGGGISRKITSAADRKRLKEVTQEMALPRGMGLIVRTAGANRPKPEIKRDCEYLLRLWDDVRERTMQSVAPALIYEEASLIKRAIRDVYSRDVDDILVDGEDGFRAARDFMRMLMPSHARKVQLWRDGLPLFARHGVEAQLDSMLNPTVQLKSGGYLVINQAEALVAIDVNSGRSTRERGIEETALRTNLEAADEVARQLRLRDLAGLIVIDFIDMEAKKHNAAVERRLKDALKNDRARIQVGHISHFGLLEMSRQRLRPSLAETSSVLCPHCGGTGHMRSTESSAMHVLREIEEEGGKRRAAEIAVHVAGSVALYVLNHKRAWLAEIEQRHAMHVSFVADDSLLPPQLRIERLRAQEAPVSIPIAQGPAPAPVAVVEAVAEDVEEEFEESEAEEDTAEATAPAPSDPANGANGSAEEQERRRRRRRRRRRGGRREENGAAPEGAEGETGSETEGEEAEPEEIEEAEAEAGTGATAEMPPPAEEVADAEGAGDARRRRGRRGGRRRRREDEGVETESGDFAPGYAGPTPADPFGGHTFDIFDVIEQQMLASEAAAAAKSPRDQAPAPIVVEPEPILAPEPQATTATSEPKATSAVPEPEATSAVPEPEATSAVPEPEATSAVPEPEATIAASEPAATTPAPEPQMESTAEAPSDEPLAVAPAEPAPELESTPEPETTTAPEPPQVAPAIQPVIVGESTTPLEKKRGWWRR